MAIDKFPLSRDARVYWNTDAILVGSASAATWQAWLDLETTIPTDIMRNLTLQTEDEMADTNTRESTRGGFSSQKPILHNGVVTFDTPWDLTDLFVAQMNIAWELFAPRGIAVLNRAYKANADNGDVAPEIGDKINGLIGNFHFTLNKDEEVTDIQRGNWTANHRDNGEWIEYTVPDPG